MHNVIPRKPGIGTTDHKSRESFGKGVASLLTPTVGQSNPMRRIVYPSYERYRTKPNVSPRRDIVDRMVNQRLTSAMLRNDSLIPGSLFGPCAH
jgi:hypothetical protein